MLGAVRRGPSPARDDEFRQRTRLHHARWREERGHPIGSQPIKPRPGVDARLVGSRIPLSYARETGATPGRGLIGWLPIGWPCASRQRA